MCDGNTNFNNINLKFFNCQSRLIIIVHFEFIFIMSRQTYPSFTIKYMGFCLLYDFYFNQKHIHLFLVPICIYFVVFQVVLTYSIEL